MALLSSVTLDRRIPWENHILETYLQLVVTLQNFSMETRYLLRKQTSGPLGAPVPR